MTGDLFIYKGHEVLPISIGYIIRGKYVSGPYDLRGSSKIEGKSPKDCINISVSLAKARIDRSIKRVDDDTKRK